MSRRRESISFVLVHRRECRGWADLDDGDPGEPDDGVLRLARCSARVDLDSWPIDENSMTWRPGGCHMTGLGGSVEFLFDLKSKRLRIDIRRSAGTRVLGP